MAKLSRLQIGGIRSFGPLDEDVQDIKFSSPVTLILGENGCGKTTIIEALKYACTGDAPEGSERGAKFIQEPKLRTSSVTKGFVKLLMTDGKGKQITINRAAKVETSKVGKLKMSKLDASINTVKPDGTEVALSGRCADIGEQICLIMGVQKSIINNVLFCHQEHSLWPLDQDSQVKEKFDEIFDATKYNKCIGDFRKHINVEKKALDSLGDALQERERKKLEVERRRANLQRDEDSLTEIFENINKKDNEIKTVTDELRKICELENVLGTLQAEKIQKETEKNSLINNRQLVIKKIKEEFPGDDNELEEAIRNFGAKKDYDAKREKDIELEITNIDTQIGEIEVEVQKIQVRVGQLEAQKRQQLEKIEDRNKDISAIVKQLKIDGSYQTEDNVKQTIANIKDALIQCEERLNKERENNQREENLQQADIDACRENLAKLKQERTIHVTQQADIHNQQRDTNSQIKQLDISDELLRNMNNKIDQFDRQIKFLLESYDSDELEKKIKITRNEIDALDKELEVLDRDYAILQKNHLTDENILTRTKDMVQKETKVIEMKNTNYKNFESLFHPDPVPNIDFQEAVKKRIREVNDELNDLKQKIDTEKHNIATREATIRMNEQKLKGYEKKVDASNDKISSIVKDNSFEEVCVKLEERIEKLHKDRGQHRSAKIIYEKFVNDFQSEKACCPVCETSFSEKKTAATAIVAKLKNQIEGIPQALVKIENELKEKQELYSKAQQLKPLYDEVKELRNSTIPELKSEITQAKESLHQAKENLKQFNDTMNRPRKLLDIANAVLSDATIIDKYNFEIDSYKREIENLKFKLIPFKSDKSREQVERARKVCISTISEKRKNCDYDTNKLNSNRKDYHDLKEQKSDVEREKLNLEKSMNNKPHLIELLIDLEKKEENTKIQMKRIDQELLPLTEKLRDSTRKLNILKDANASKYKKDMEEFNRLRSTAEHIIKDQRTIDLFADKDIDNQLRNVLDKFKRYKADSEALNLTRKELSEKIVVIREERAKAEIDKRNLEENVEIRKKAKEIKTLTASIEQLKEKIGSYDYAKLKSKKLQLERQHMQLIKEDSNIRGQKEVLEKNINGYKTELNLPENKNAYNIYKRTLYEVETKRNSINDAKIYCIGLEEAIIQFHKEKMSKINETIKHLWRSVYRGNDIDYIQIQTENPHEQNASKRSYNYRVIQIKNDVEIDMRGRCSAGQKVLACLLIRMALAMTFSHNCGILALDEPTTNLDRDNISSLCETLATMIQNRRIEKNFQLLIITHDEEFIKRLSQLENIDHCLRVSRNRQGNTVIKTEYLY